MFSSQCSWKDLSIGCFEMFFLRFPTFRKKNIRINHASLGASIKKPNGCGRIMVFTRKDLNLDRRDWNSRIMDENGWRLDSIDKLKIWIVRITRIWQGKDCVVIRLFLFWKEVFNLVYGQTKLCYGCQMLDEFNGLSRFHRAIFGKVAFLFTDEVSAFLVARSILGVGLFSSEESELFTASLPWWGWKLGFS